MKSVLISRASVLTASAFGFFMHSRLRVFIFSKWDIVSSEGLKDIRTYQKREQAFSPCKDSLCRLHQCPSASCRGAFSDEDIYSIDPYSWSHQWIFNTPLTASANHMVFQMLSILSSNITRKKIGNDAPSLSSSLFFSAQIVLLAWLSSDLWLYHSVIC